MSHELSYLDSIGASGLDKSTIQLLIIGGGLLVAMLLFGFYLDSLAYKNPQREQYGSNYVMPQEHYTTIPPPDTTTP